MVRIILLMDGVSEFDRKLLRGLVRFSKESGDFLFYRMPMALTASSEEGGGKMISSWARKWKADAIIGRWNFADTRELEKLGIPIVLQNVHKRSEKFSNLTGDYIGTGAIAASFFYKRCHVNYAYFGIKDLIWSEERLLGFREKVEEFGGKVHQLMVSASNERDEKHVTAWLKSLPKPVALFACDDSHALFIAEACKMAGISIPDEISLLGVDDDELVCEISDPPISSISLNVEQGGYDVGRELTALLDRGGKHPFNVTIAPGPVIQRASTRLHNISDPYICKLVKYIDDNFSQDISTSQILAQIPLSRRSIELKFKKEMGGLTIYKYLMMCRIDYFEHLLSMTDLPLSEIATMSGISDYSNFSRIFKKQKGISPLEFRKKQSIRKKL